MLRQTLLTMSALVVGMCGGCGKEAVDVSTAKLAVAEPRAEDITDAEAEQYYREHPAEFTARERVRASDIHTPDRKAADRMLKAARALARTNAAGFATLAKTNSSAGPTAWATATSACSTPSSRRTLRR
jgi:hypothetical protein